MQTEHLADRDLVIAFQAGDATVFDKIDRRYRPMAQRVCSRILIDPSDVEDAVQETMVAVFRALPRFNGSYLLGAYIARIAANRSLDILRRKKRHPQLPLSESLVQALEAHDDPVDQVLRLDEAETVKLVLAEMPSTHAEALRMRMFNDASHEDIGLALDITAPKAKALLHRARGTFKSGWIARVSAILIAIGTVGKRFSSRSIPDASGVDVGRVASGPSQLMAAASNLASSSPVLLASAEPAATATAKFVSTATAAAVLAFGSGAGVVISRNSPEPPTSFAVPEVVERPAMEPSPSEYQAVYPSLSPTSEAAPSTSAQPESATPAPSDSPSSAEPSPSSSAPTGSDQPSPSPSDTSTSSPSPSPTTSPEPVPAPFLGLFTSSLLTGARCGCDRGTLLITSSSSGSPEGQLTSNWRLDGGLVDRDNHAAWRHTTDISFDVEGETGSGTFSSTVVDQDMTSRYDLVMSLTSRKTDADGYVTLAFQAPYSAGQGPFASGVAMISLVVDKQGNPVQSSVRFEESTE